MQGLGGACEEGERTIKRFKTTRSSLPPVQVDDFAQTITTSEPPTCVFEKVFELYRKESDKEKTSEAKLSLKGKSHILEKLVLRERLNTFILNLHPGNIGYSVACKRNSTINQISDDTANMTVIKEFTYEDQELLGYIDNQEIPPPLTQLLESEYSFLFYNGCVIAEIRDYRQFQPPSKCDIHHVLLRPTQQSLLADINNICKEKPDWSTDERQEVESQMLLTNAPMLCLDPDNTISTIRSHINHNSQMWNTLQFRLAARKFSQDTVNRKRKLGRYTYKPGLELYEYISRTRVKPKTDDSCSVNKISRKSQEDFKVSKWPRKLQDDIKPIPVPNLDPPPITAPTTQPIIIKEFKTFQRLKETSDCLPQLIEEYVLETDMPSKDKEKPRIYHIKLSILQRPSNLEYLGELYLDRDHKRNERNGVTCRFILGSRTNANRYIHQFADIFTESGRKSVRINYGLSPGYKERIAMAQIQADNAAQTNSTQEHSSYPRAPLVNGAVSSRISLVQPNQSVQNASNLPVLQSHLQNSLIKPTTSQASSQESKINAIANDLMIFGQQIQAAANAKQQQKSSAASNSNNTVMINLLNSSSPNNLTSDVVGVSAMNANNSALSSQVQTSNQKTLARKMTLSNVANPRVLNHNLIAVNSRMNISDVNQQQNQTITLTSVGSDGNYTNYTGVPIKQQFINQQIITNNSSDNESALSALLVTTPAANRPNIVGPNTNSLLLEKIANSTGNANGSSIKNSTHFIPSIKPGMQYMVQSPPKAVTPLSSPPPQQTSNIINYSSLQNVPRLQNLQVQLPGFSEPISLLVSLPVTTATTSTVTQTVRTLGNRVNSVEVGSSVVLANPAQFMSPGAKALAPQSIREDANSTLSGESYQVMQRPRLQQIIQRTPITLKMATHNTNVAEVMPSNSHLQKQAHLQRYQVCMNPQQKNLSSSGENPKTL